MTQDPFAGLHEDDALVVERTYKTMSDKLLPSEFTLREKIALACRFLADEGHAPTLAGQISARTVDGTFWTTAFDKGFADATATSMVRVNNNLEVLEGEGMPNPGTRFHSWVYAARPDVQAIVHTHPPHISALTISAERLIISHMDMTMFHDDVAYLDNWPGVPIANEEGHIISEAIAEKNTILLANHGMLTVGDTLERATFLAGHVEFAARVQLLAMGAGLKPKDLEPALAAEAKRFTTSPKFVGATFDYWARRMARKFPEALEPGTADRSGR
jgi:L-fuculose-phosphate aldolase